MSKAIGDLVFPDDVRYTDDHEWARQEGENVTAGITDYAQDQLGDIVFVELPEVGSSYSAGDEFGSLQICITLFAVTGNEGNLLI